MPESRKKHYRKRKKSNNHISEEKLILLQLELFELYDNINSIDDCNRIIAIGNTLLKSNIDNNMIIAIHTCLAAAYYVAFRFNENPENLTKAKYYFEKVIEVNSKHEIGLVTLFDIHLRQNRFNDAIDVLEKVDENNTMLTDHIVSRYYEKVFDEPTYTEDEKYEFQSLTESLLKKYEKTKYYPFVCTRAMTYYEGIGDVIKAYELGHANVEKVNQAAIYSNFAYTCIHPRIKKYEDALIYSKKAFELATSIEEANLYKPNYIAVLYANEKYDEAEKISNDLIKSKESDANFQSHAKILYKLEKYDEALKWANKALSLAEDIETLVLIANIYNKTEKLDYAIDLYKKSLGYIKAGSNFVNRDENGKLRKPHGITNEYIQPLIDDIYDGLISICFIKNEYGFAKAYLHLAKEDIHQSQKLEMWDKVLDKTKLDTQVYEKTKKALVESEKQIAKLKDTMKNVFKSLSNFKKDLGEIDLDDEAEWTNFETKINEIITEMSDTIDKQSKEYAEIELSINTEYDRLSDEAKKFLLTAESLYRLDNSSIIDFGPIIVEYSKVVETQLNILLKTKLPVKLKMLGQIIGYISDNKLIPYDEYIEDLSSINNKRRESAHTGLLTKPDVDDVRKILFDDGLLKKLM